MKQLILMSLIVCACSNTQVMAIELPVELCNKHVLVHLKDGLTDNAEQVAGTLVRHDHTGLLLKLDSDGKLYWYPEHRLSGVEVL